MTKKRESTPLDVAWEIIIFPAWYWIIVIIPSLISIYQFLGGDMKMLAAIPSWIWLPTSTVLIALTLLVSAYRYVQRSNLARRGKRKKRRSSSSMKAKAGGSGQAVVVAGNNYAPIIANHSNTLGNHQETSPNIIITDFNNEVLTLKLVRKNDNGQTVQVGIGETIERFYVEFVNKKKVGIRTEDAVKIYVRIAFYTTDCKLIKSHDKPRWWTKYDPLDEDTWEAQINLEASEKPEKLFLVLRRYKASELYIFSRESHRAVDWILPEMNLSEKSNYVHIRLSAKNLDAQDFWILIENLGKEKPLFRILEQAPCRETLAEQANDGRDTSESKVEARATTLEAFSHHLDDCLKEILSSQPTVGLSGMGKNFIKKIKATPPFLGLDTEQFDLVISPDLERQLTKYFSALEFSRTYGKHIRGGYSYRIKANDTPASVAENEYGDKKYSGELGRLSFPIGSYIYLPPIDITGSLNLSSEYLRLKLGDTQTDWLIPYIVPLVERYSLADEETVPILTAAYNAAQRTIKDGA